MSGPLSGIKVIEIAGIGPGPFAAMMLADMGAEVVRVDRAGAVGGDASKPNLEILNRGRRSIGVDLKSPDGVETVLALVEQADALIEGFRPGVTERLGIGPDACLARNPKLVYGRMTGWGQDGPYAQAAGHDINYIALGGALAHFGRAGTKPTPPINVVGDFGGGGMLMAFGVACALVEAGRSGQGQVVDAAMVDGSAIAHDDDVGLPGPRHLGVVRHQRARHRRAVLRHLRDLGRQVHLARIARAAVLRGADRAPRAHGRGRHRPADGPVVAGPSCGSGSPRCSRPGPATNGARSSR